MVFLLTLILGFIFTLGIFTPTYDYMYGSYVEYSLGYKVGCWIIGLSIIGFIIGCFHVNDDQHEIEEKPWAELVAVADAGATKGNFSIFSGNIDEVQYYFYYYDDGNGGYKQSRVPAYQTQIVEKPEVDPQLIKVVDNDYGWRTWGYEAGNSSTWKIVVPEGTIVRQFNLDLED